MLVIGLTGGIGSGKSTAADLFAARGVPVIDADAVARELVEPGMPALTEIESRFGHSVITAEGRLDRAELGRQVFADSSARSDLEAILHPRIRERMQAQLRKLDAPYCLLVIPLLVETGQRDLVQRVLVVDAPEATQRQRIAQRDARSSAQLDHILAAQADRQTRLSAADDVIHNDGDLAGLEAQVEALHQKYLQMASK